MSFHTVKVCSYIIHFFLIKSVTCHPEIIKFIMVLKRIWVFRAKVKIVNRANFFSCNAFQVMEDLLVVSLEVPGTFCSTQVLTETENRIICLAIGSILLLFFHYPNSLNLGLMKFISSRIPSFFVNFWTFHVFVNLWASGLWNPFPSLLVVNLR